MTGLWWSLTLSPVVLGTYAYVLYPAALSVMARKRPIPLHRTVAPDQLPTVSITVPMYNEAENVRELLESLLALDYPAHLRQILIVSDASDDGTDEIVTEYEDRGVELFRLPQRTGKTHAENLAAPHLRGEIVVNTDASIRIAPDALRKLVEALADPSVGVASGRDVSVASAGDDSTAEGSYVGYEMWVRGLETRVAGIVGASGSLYAIRAHLHSTPLPPFLSRDFSSALIAREHGYRAVSVEHAVCTVPRSTSIRKEYRRKVRTMLRGMQSLLARRHLLNPARHGLFAWSLASHKGCRWLLPWTLPAAGIGLLALAPTRPWLWAPIGAAAAVGGLAAAGWAWSARAPLPKVLAVPTLGVLANLAVLHASVRLIRGGGGSVWEPTRRQSGGNTRQRPFPEADVRTETLPPSIR
jgi:cellulose synthase/poly-beta-1,6-N-acetylglucosamine synthase-like glycosyltransferase